ncbi:uncharacterized protein RCC_12212 [Ramularia collo-cygni]|uniref:Uncharacterized protein n=2 Tax=Ramularia collo-cygni TaxID=112498 RepID=A0A2D3UXD0_9PEZI|nr:uncharacterized protein RCC_12212 [Ramularia collo-cygni]CZT16947.1 uncharacterized protein RCC_12212 [Ramularia collo-cygni]
MEIFAAQCRAWHGRLASGVSSIIAHDAGLLEKVSPLRATVDDRVRSTDAQRRSHHMVRFKPGLWCSQPRVYLGRKVLRDSQCRAASLLKHSGRTTDKTASNAGSVDVRYL